MVFIISYMKRIYTFLSGIAGALLPLPTGIVPLHRRF